MESCIRDFDHSPRAFGENRSPRGPSKCRSGVSSDRMRVSPVTPAEIKRHIFGPKTANQCRRKRSHWQAPIPPQWGGEGVLRRVGQNAELAKSRPGTCPKAKRIEDECCREKSKATISHGHGSRRRSDHVRDTRAVVSHGKSPTPSDELRLESKAVSDDQPLSQELALARVTDAERPSGPPPGTASWKLAHPNRVPLEAAGPTYGKARPCCDSKRLSVPPGQVMPKILTMSRVSTITCGATAW
jgi:hypothetical protein